MSLKLAQFCDDPKKYPQNLHTPPPPPPKKKIFIFRKTPKNNEIQNFEPSKKIARAYACMKISEYSPPPPPPPPPPGIETMHKLKTAHSFSRLSPALFRAIHSWNYNHNICHLLRMSPGRK